MTASAWMIAAGVTALVTALGYGYYCWSKHLRGINPLGPGARFNAGLPFLIGMAAGLLLLSIGAGWIAAHDRFYVPIHAARLYLLLIPAACIVLLSGFRPPGSWMRTLLFQVVAAAIAVAAGVRFEMVKFIAIPSGGWSVLFTIVWLLLAMNIVRLLEGLEGGVPVLVLVTAALLFLDARGHGEQVLAALCLVVCGAVLGSLRFSIRADRLPLRGPAVVLFGFIFAVLTVLARQKTGAALLLMLPLALVMLITAGATLSFLEKGLMLRQEKNPEKNGDEQ